MADTKPIYGVDMKMFPAGDASASDPIKNDPMKWLREKAGIRFSCFYLAPAPFHSDTSWMSMREQLACAGWGFIPTYLGEQAHSKDSHGNPIQNPKLSAAKGGQDGKNACDLMKQAGFPTGSVVYLDLEEGDVPAGAYQVYILAWLTAVKAQDFVPAIYCTSNVLDWSLRYARIVWLAAPQNLDSQGHVVAETLDPADLPGCGLDRGSIATQFLWEIAFAGAAQPIKCDLNVSMVADPSNFASVDEALKRYSEGTYASAANWVQHTARIAMERLSTIIPGGAAPANNPTSDPHCGALSSAPDRIMSNDKVALDLAESALSAGLVETTMDIGPPEEDFSQMEIASSGRSAIGDKFPDVKWPDKDDDAPDYHHLVTSQIIPPPDGGAEFVDFELTPVDVELVLSANRMNPIGFGDMTALAIRGARLGRKGDTGPIFEVEGTTSVFLTDQRPDHKNFRCLIGFYERATDPAARKMSLFVGSTVPNAEYVKSWFDWANGRTRSGLGNMLPTGCYVYRVGTHNSPHAGPIKPALRLTDSYNLQADGSATVIRTKNNQMYDVDDIWCQIKPGDNVHCSFQTSTVGGWGAPFSSAGCLTIRGLSTPSEQWAKAQAILNKITMDKRCDVILVTGRDLAVASKLRKSGEADQPDIVQRELGRLRPGSQGEEVARLQKFLSLDQTGYFGSILKKALVVEQAKREVAIDGIFSPALDLSWGAGVFNARPAA